MLRDALETVLARNDVLPPPAGETPPAPPAGSAPAELETDPAIVADLVARSRASIEALRHDMRDRSGTALIDLILADFDELKRVLTDPRSQQAIRAGMGALEWLNDNLETWLGEKGAADVLMQSVPDNVTSEMGRALLDVADTIRRHPEVVAFLERASGDGFLDELTGVDDGGEPRDAIRAFLDQYGMRCVGEIDITRPRWNEHPIALMPLILGNVRNFEPGAAQRQFEQGLREADKKERDAAGGAVQVPWMGVAGSIRANEARHRPGSAEAACVLHRSKLASRSTTSAGRGWITSRMLLPWTATSSARCWSRPGSARLSSMR